MMAHYTGKELRQRAEAFARQHGFQLDRPLGFGNDGAVWETTRGSALKIEERRSGYERELAAYHRLRERGVLEIAGFTVPQLLDYDDDLLAIEMTIVFPPSVLDFAKAYLDRPPDFSPEVLADWEAETEDLFGDGWAVVCQVLAELRTDGIIYFDAQPGNIRLADDERT
jgi:hypothetical protein